MSEIPKMGNKPHMIQVFSGAVAGRGSPRVLGASPELTAPRPAQVYRAGVELHLSDEIAPWGHRSTVRPQSCSAPRSLAWLRLTPACPTGRLPGEPGAP